MSMTLTPFMLVMLCGVMFAVALLYASVGHGGASGYLAIWSFVAGDPRAMAASALWLNVLVAGTAWVLFARAGHFSWRLTWPFVIAAAPTAFLGGRLLVTPSVYGGLLALTLCVAACRLVITASVATQRAVHPPPLAVAVPAGAGVGLASGIVGIGGGIFLSPLLLLRQWATPKQVAATSASFIVATSLAGLLGRAQAGQWEVAGAWPMILSAFLGGVLGARLGANHFSGQLLRRLLAVVLVMASLKLLWRSLA